MTNPLGAISAVNAATSSQPGQPTSATFAGETFSAQSLAESGSSATPASGLSSTFQTFMENFQSSGANFEGSVNAGGANDPVAAARASMTGGADAKSVVLAPAPSPDAMAAKNPGTEVLQKSFDHAVFVSLVSQIVSGVSQATSTLVRQQ